MMRYPEKCCSNEKTFLILVMLNASMQRFRTDGYSWCEDFDVELEKIEEQLSELK